MLYDANITNLKRCVRNNEKAPDFYLGAWVHPCGTYGCLVGNDYLAAHKYLGEQLLDWSSEEYGLSRLMAQFLFCSSNCGRRAGVGLSLVDYGTGLLFCGHSIRNEDARDSKDRTAAINRLNKLIAYIERKRAIWYEADGRISERARRTEGNWGVCASVLNSIAVSA